MKLTYFDGMCKGTVAPFLCEMASNDGASCTGIINEHFYRLIIVFKTFFLSVTTVYYNDRFSWLRTYRCGELSTNVCHVGYNQNKTSAWRQFPDYTCTVQYAKKWTFVGVTWLLVVNMGAAYVKNLILRLALHQFLSCWCAGTQTAILLPPSHKNTPSREHKRLNTQWRLFNNDRFGKGWGWRQCVHFCLVLTCPWTACLRLSSG